MDCNNFFVSCERLFRPDLRSRPVAVLSSNDGCIVARSQEVKDLGIPMGVPLFEVKDIVKKHDVRLFSSNFPLYRDISSRVMYALREEFDIISVYSVDEAFFTVPEGMTILQIQDIRERIVRKTGIPVSFGLAPTKTIAKLANSEAKRTDGVVSLSLDAARTQYGTISCGSVWGIGREMTKRLNEFRIRTVADFIEKGPRFARNEFGVHGERLYLELTGTVAEGVHKEFSPHASIMSTRSFGRKTNDAPILMSAIGYHVEHVGKKLRERGLLARKFSLICAPSRYGTFALRSGSASLICEEPTNDTGMLLRYAQRLFNEFYDREVNYAKAGVIVSELIPDAYVARSLFTPQDGARRDSVYAVVDRLNQQYGKGTIHSGLVSHTGAWASQSTMRSPGYTTEWSEIATARAV